MSKQQIIKVLYLEDEHFLGRIVKESLSSRGYDIHLIADGAQLMEAYDSFEPQICVLDIMVPNIDGLTLAKMIRERNPAIPIIFLTAKNQTQDVLEGFRSGGNDYIKKPFSMEELMVRINNLVNFGTHKESDSNDDDKTIGLYIFNYKLFQLRFQDEIIQLSHRENELLYLLSTHINQHLDRKLILNKIWGNDSIYNSRNLDVYIRKLRVYFEKDPNIELKTLRGVGYHLIVKS